MSNLNRKITLQKASLLWENVWAALQKPLLVLGFAIIIIASGILFLCPKYMQIAALALLALAFLISLKDVLKLKSPSHYAAMRRLEQASTLPHRAVSSHQDNLVAEQASSETKALWQEHQLRKLASLKNLKVAKPLSAWRNFDPMAVRVPVALGAIAALLLGPGNMWSNSLNLANLAAPITTKALTIDAWLRPPPYTAKAPTLLTSPAMREKLMMGGDISVAENASLSLRVQGAAKPHIAFYALGDAATELTSITAKTTNTESGFSSEIKIDRPVLIKLTDGATELASWPITTVPDLPPTLKIIGEPKSEKLGSTNISWEVADDYGVKTIVADISLADQQENDVGFESNGVFLFDAPVFKISLRHLNAKTETGSTTNDLASHPWAGLYVELVLTATDGAGHTTATPPKRFKMPERLFSKPLAAALIEQRKTLILNPDAAPDVATMLDAILTYPFSIRDNAGLVLNLAAIKSALAYAGDTDDVAETIKKLWPLAVAIEDGALADARAELKALKQQLEQALRDGAPPEKIAELTEKMRKAMDKLLDQMRREAERRKADGEKQQSQTREISPEALQKMLDDIKKLSESGSKEAAEQLLSELDKLLQNLQPGTGSQSGQNGDPSLQNKMDELSNMMRRQQQLMDETQRLQDGENGKGLSGRQGKLSQELDRLGQSLDGETQGDLGGASKNMKDAEGKLGQHNKDDALQQQGEAMQKMQEGAKKLGKKLAEQGQGKTGEQGKDGQAGGSNDDPLGRPRATHNPDQGPNKNVLPSEMALRKAREILEQLRNRSGDHNLSDTEKSYIERLLQGLY
jgi:uncharacterized protein (TIGR02302 family)